MPVASSPIICDKQKCLQTLANVTWEARLFLIGNDWLEGQILKCRNAGWQCMCLSSFIDPSGDTYGRSDIGCENWKHMSNMLPCCIFFCYIIFMVHWSTLIVLKSSHMVGHTVCGHAEDWDEILINSPHAECAAHFCCFLDVCVTLAIVIMFSEPPFFIYKLGLIMVSTSWSQSED